MSLTLGWYYHLPPCAEPREVDLAVRESLDLLLDAHHRSGAAVGLALTGGMLAHMEGRFEDSLRLLSELIARGTVELMATSFHEVCPFLIPPHYLRQQIEADLAIKWRLLRARPRAFWPGNCAWAPVQAPMLAACGLETSVVGEAHLREAQQTQLWRWLQADAMHMGTALIDTTLTDGVQARGYRLAAGPDHTLTLLVQEDGLRRALSFGAQGAIHHPWDDQPLDALVTQLENTGSLLESTARRFSGDDGDRINPVSIHQYRRCLQRIGQVLLPPSAGVADARADTLAFLPAHAPGGMAFWQDSVAQSYLQMLDALYRAVDQQRIDCAEVLPLQDVFPIFWKRVARARWFHERAWALLQRAGG